MRLAIAKAGLWCFGVMTFVFVVMGGIFKGMSFGEEVGWLLFIGFLAGGLSFFWYFHEIETEKPEKETEAQRRESGVKGEEADR